jgi:putative chitobiose transport system permease protein
MTRGTLLPTLTTLAIALLFLYPLLQLFSSSAGYTHLLTDPAYLCAALVSLTLAGTISLGCTFFAALAGYVLACFDFPGRRLYILALILIASLPAQLLVPGGYELIIHLGLFDSLAAVVLPALASVFSALLLRAAFTALPPQLLEAARVDGCTELALLLRIALPAIAPTASACLLLTFVASYNAVVWPAIVLQSADLQPLPLHLLTLSATALTPQEQAQSAAATVLAIAPILLLFTLLQRAFLPPLQGAEK